MALTVKPSEGVEEVTDNGAELPGRSRDSTKGQGLRTALGAPQDQGEPVGGSPQCSYWKLGRELYANTYRERN